MRWISASTTPASTVMVSLAMSMPRTAFMRAVEMITSLRLASGWLAPVRPVLPPCGTIRVPVSAQMPTRSATSWVVFGRSTTGTSPIQPSRQLRQ